MNRDAWELAGKIAAALIFSLAVAATAVAIFAQHTPQSDVPLVNARAKVQAPLCVAPWKRDHPQTSRSLA